MELYLKTPLKRRIAIDSIVIAIGCITAYLLSFYFDALDKFYQLSRSHEQWELDETLAICVFLSVALGIFAFRRWLELRKALAELKQLRGILPVCASCKKIRDNSGQWQPIEIYIRDHSEAEFSHGLCPDCMTRLYGEGFKKED